MRKFLGIEAYGITDTQQQENCDFYAKYFPRFFSESAEGFYFFFSASLKVPIFLFFYRSQGKQGKKQERSRDPDTQ